MSHQATTLLFSVGLLRKQQAGVRLFRDYEEMAIRKSVWKCMVHGGMRNRNIVWKG